MTDVCLIHIDGSFSNPALMKISAHHKERGDRVVLQRANVKRQTFNYPLDMLAPDKIYISCVFSENLDLAKKIHNSHHDSMLGGPALETPNRLPPEMDHLMPDYSLYPENNYSIGKTQEGCIRDCGFCIVPKIEGCYKEYAEIKEFHNPSHKNVIILDNNILASRPRLLDEKFKYINESGAKFSFCQGFDARLVTKEIANRLSKMKCYNVHFGNRCYYFAWDFMKNEKTVLRGLNNMLEAGIPSYQIMVYVLVGYTGIGQTTHDQDMYRFRKLRELGVDPFIMKYNNRKDDLFLNHLARWVNRRVYKLCKFSEYDHLDEITKREAMLLE